MSLYLDETTLKDLSIFHQDDSKSVFEKFNFTRTVGGSMYLRNFFASPAEGLDAINSVQQLLKTILAFNDKWPVQIGNGTIFIMEKFCSDPYSGYSSTDGYITRLGFQLTNSSEYSMLKFGLKIFNEFFRGLRVIHEQLIPHELPVPFDRYKSIMTEVFKETTIIELADLNAGHEFTSKEIFYFAHFLRVSFINHIKEAIDIYQQLEAYHSLALGIQKYRLTFPTVNNYNHPVFEATGLRHLMVDEAKSYNVSLTEKKALLFLTGSNMSGKSTFIKSVALSLYLAHLGMAVAADNLQLGLFDGLSTNLNIEDDISKGQSYFFNEVKRIKEITERVKENSRWMILIDEIFKGTNVIDAMKCSIEVISGFSRVKNSVFIISTHFFEIAKDLKHLDNISFRYMETIVDEDRFRFTYQLKQGVSNEHIGYSIMKREGVVDLLRCL